MQSQIFLTSYVLQQYFPPFRLRLFRRTKKFASLQSGILSLNNPGDVASAPRALSTASDSVEADSVETDSVEADLIQADFEHGPDIESGESGTLLSESRQPRKRSKKRKIYCFNCNRQEFHIMAYKGTWLHSFLVGMTFGATRVLGPYRCTCCGRKRAMFADYCSLSYHWRMYTERRLSKTGRRRRRSRRRK